MGRSRWWLEDGFPIWVPNMSCFRPSVTNRESQRKSNEESSSTSPLDGEDGFHQLRQNNARKKWSYCRKMVWRLTLLLFSDPNSRSTGVRATPRLGLRAKKRVERGENRSWLLAESKVEEDRSGATTTVVDSQSMNSSFRFSFGSQVEAEVSNSGDSPDCCSRSPATAATATVLILNLEEKEEEEDFAPCSSYNEDRKRHLLLLKCRRLQSLERSISPVIATGLIRYSYSEISAATEEFHEGRVLGRGALSCVYKGRIGWGMTTRRKAVAVKKILGPEKECAKAFCRELLTAGSLRNPNVVPILGFCIDRQGLFLVYKYVSGGSLDLHLHPEHDRVSDKDGCGLSWSMRFKIALGTAHAVEYLHYGTDRCIVHRDIKPSNILLSHKKNPKLCDFGLATWTHGPSIPFLCKNVRGTFGYLAPEYFQHGKLSEKTDVYAFGVVLLELITGRKPIDTTRPHGEENLVLWAKPLLLQPQTCMKDMVDPRLKTGTSNKNEIFRTICAATACLNNDESCRPRITDVIGMLRGEGGEPCGGRSVVAGNGCFAGFEMQNTSPHAGADVRGHLALAMLGISDEHDDAHDDW